MINGAMAKIVKYAIAAASQCALCRWNSVNASLASGTRMLTLALSSSSFFRAAGSLTRARCFATPAFNLNDEILGGLAPGLDQVSESCHDPPHILSPSGYFLGVARDT